MDVPPEDWKIVPAEIFDGRVFDTHVGYFEAQLHLCSPPHIRAFLTASLIVRFAPSVLHTSKDMPAIRQGEERIGIRDFTIEESLTRPADIEKYHEHANVLKERHDVELSYLLVEHSH